MRLLLSISSDRLDYDDHKVQSCVTVSSAKLTFVEYRLISRSLVLNNAHFITFIHFFVTPRKGIYHRVDKTARLFISRLRSGKGERVKIFAGEDNFILELSIDVDLAWSFF